MRVLLFITFYALMFSAAVAQYREGYKYLKSDLQELNLKGRVKSIEVSLYEYRDGVDVVNPRLISSTLFNKSGNKIFETARFDKSSLSLDSFFYDQHARIVLEKHVVKKTQYSYHYTEDPAKNLIETLKENSRTVRKTIYQKSGDPTIIIVYGAAGEIDSKTTCRYDNRHNKIEDIIQYSHSREKSKLEPYDVLPRKTYAYNANGDKLSETFYDKKKHINSWSKFKYDKWGNQILEIDSNIVRVGGSGTTQQKGNLTYIKTRYPQIDKYGNWLQMDSMEEGKVRSKWVKKIEYY